MKQKYIYKILAVILLFNVIVSFSQTTLMPGDIAVFQNQADTPDDFAFVTFVDIDAGTGIYFTDCGVDSTTGFNTPCVEGAQKYTVPSGGLMAGDIVKFSTSSDFAAYTDSRITGGFALASSGDQVVVFQDATSATGGTNAGNNPTFLFILHNSSTQFGGTPTDTNESQVPAGLSDTGLPRTAVAVGAGSGVDVEWDDTIYNNAIGYDFSGPTLVDAIAAAKIAFTNPDNFIRVNDINDAAYSAAVAAIPASLNLAALSTDSFETIQNSIYPNPVRDGKLFINSSSSEVKDVTIYNILGRKVIDTKVTPGNEINVGNLSAGMYMVTITENNKTQTKKIVIQ